MLKKTLFAIAVLMVGYVVIAVGWPPRPTPLFIPPVTLADGSVEYQLIDRGADDVRGTEDDPVWVLRFPKGMYVRNPDLLRTEEQIERNPAWKNNWELSLAMRMPDFADLVDPYGEDRGVPKLSIRLTAAEKIYGAGIYQPAGMGDSNSFSSTASLQTDYMCQRGATIAPGVVQLRESTDAELQSAKAALDEKFGIRAPDLDTLRYCPVKRSERWYYALFNNGKIVGQGNCYDLSEKVSPCSFFVWLPQQRVAQLSFDANYLDQTREIYQRVVALLTTATDTDKSRNLGP